MDQQFQTSFIPRKPSTTPSAPTYVPRTNVSAPTPPSKTTSIGLGILSLFTTIFFLGTIFSAVGIYLYNITLTKNINSITEQLKIAQKSYQSSLITTLEQTDKRLKSANEVFSNHIIVSPIFYALQSLTLKSIAFNNFSYEFSDEGNVIVKLSGRANNYESIALQSDTLSTNRFIKDPVFSNLNLDDDGKVLFDLEFVVDKVFVNFITDTNKANAVDTTLDVPNNNEILIESETNDVSQMQN